MFYYLSLLKIFKLTRFLSRWQVLTNGDEVKLQRNALSVIEGPSGLEEVEDNEDYSFPSRTSQGL